MVWHDKNPWRSKWRERAAAHAQKPATERIASILKRVRSGDVSIDDALVQAYGEGFADGSTENNQEKRIET